MFHSPDRTSNFAVPCPTNKENYTEGFEGSHSLNTSLSLQKQQN